MLQAILFCLALCTDTFVAGMAYGADGVDIDGRKMALMSAVSTACLGAALGFGTLLRTLVPEALVRLVAFVSLFLIGCIRLSDSLIKNYINRRCGVRKDIHFSFSRLRFILSIYGNPTEADADRNRILSMKEAVFFGLAMSIDSLAAGTFAAFLHIPVGLYPGRLLSLRPGGAGRRTGAGKNARFPQPPGFFLGRRPDLSGACLRTAFEMKKSFSG